PGLGNIWTKDLLRRGTRRRRDLICLGVAIDVEARFEMVLDEFLLQQVKRLFGRIDELEEIAVLPRDSSLLGQQVEVDDLLPVAGAIDEDGDLLGQLLGLRQGQQLEHLVERAETAREDNQRLRQVGKPVL